MLDVARTGVAELSTAIPQDIWPALAEDAQHLEDLLALRLASGVVVALRTRERTVGLLTLGRTPDREPFVPDDLGLISDLAERAAVAIENALAHEQRDAQAKALQDALLPPRLPTVEGLDLAVTFRPIGGADVGGDLYDVFPVNLHGVDSWMVLVGDVCGKGAEAAAVTALVRWTARTAAKSDASPSSVLSTCNQVLLDADLGDRFATVAVAVLDVDADGRGARACVASGGHPLPMLRRLNGDAVPVGATGPLLGVFRAGDWPETTVELEPGEALLVFTDGLLEARSPSGEFAPQLLEQVLRATVGAEAEATAEAVLHAVDTLECGSARDDLAFLIAQVPPTANELVHIRIPGTPTGPSIELDERLDELLRELELVRLSENGSTYAQRVLTVLGGLLERFADARGSMRDQAELASFLGEPTFTAELLLPPISRTAIEELRQVLVQVAEFARQGELLTLPPDMAALGPTTSWFA